MTMDSGVKFQFIHLPSLKLCSKLLSLSFYPSVKWRYSPYPLLGNFKTTERDMT